MVSLHGLSKIDRGRYIQEFVVHPWDQCLWRSSERRLQQKEVLTFDELWTQNSLGCRRAPELGRPPLYKKMLGYDWSLMKSHWLCFWPWEKQLSLAEDDSQVRTDLSENSWVLVLLAWVRMNTSLIRREMSGQVASILWSSVSGWFFIFIVFLLLFW